MWTRKELKDQAKAGLKRNYWKSVIIGFLVSLSPPVLLPAQATARGATR